MLDGETRSQPAPGPRLAWVLLPLLLLPETGQIPAVAVLPALTPALFAAALARLARSWPLAVLGGAFVAVHVAHPLW